MKNRRPLKVLICNFESLQTPNGVASYAIKLLRYLPCMEALTTQNAFKTPLEKKETNLDAKTLYNEIFWMKPANFALMYRKIRESDLLHLNPFNFTEQALLFLAKILGKKCIATMHSNINYHHLSPVIALEMMRLILVYNMTLLIADKMVYLSRAHYENYRKYSFLEKAFLKKAVIIPNAIESEKIIRQKKLLPNNPLICIFVGRFERRKGIYDLLSLAEGLQGEDIHFLIVGYGHLQCHKPLTNVTFVGRVKNENIFDYYDKSHVYLMPSYSEAFSITLLEAMARGLALLTSDIPGIREIIQEERNGYFFQPGDIAKMKERLLYMKDHPKEIVRIGQNNLKDVLRFSVQKQADQYLKVYRHVLGHDQNPL
jgi:glycosyltransferase involved in cell wall biosynthesis